MVVNAEIERYLKGNDSDGAFALTG